MCQTLVKVTNVSCYNNHFPNLSGFTQHRFFLTQVKLSVGCRWGRDGEPGLCSTQSQGPSFFPWSHSLTLGLGIIHSVPCIQPGIRGRGDLEHPMSSFPTFISAGVHPSTLCHRAAPNWKGAGEGDLSVYLGERKRPDSGEQGQSVTEADSLLT